MVAAHQAGEQKVTRVATSKGCVFAAASEDLLRPFERLLVDERLMQTWMRFAVPTDQAAVGGIGEDQLQRVRRPALLARRRRSFGIERAGDRRRAELAFGIEVEDAT